MYDSTWINFVVGKRFVLTLVKFIYCRIITLILSISLSTLETHFECVLNNENTGNNSFHTASTCILLSFAQCL
jgi:hypothetical protein